MDCVHRYEGYTHTPGSTTHTQTCTLCGAQSTPLKCDFTQGACVCGAALAVTLPADLNLTYNGKEQKPGVTVTVDGTELAAEKYQINYDNNINAGNTAKVTVTAANGGFSGSVSTTFSIGKASLTIKANDQTITYGGNIATGTNQVTSTGLASGDTLESVTLEASTSDVPGGTIKPTGVKIQNASGADVTENYKITYETGDLTINPTDVNLTFNDQTVTYGDAPAPATADPASAKIKYSYITSEGDEPISGWPTNAGTYTVTAKVEATGNYGEATATAQLTINKAPLTITGATVASKPYDSKDTATVSGVTFTGLVNGETLALGTDYTAIGTFADANAGEGKSVTVTVTLADTAKANNYNLTPNTTTATADIAKASSSITTAPPPAGSPMGRR